MFENRYLLTEKLLQIKNTVVTLSSILQNPFSTLCGEYCLFFSYHLSRDFNLLTVSSFFTNDTVRNDQNVKDFVWRKFPGHERDFTNIFWSEQNRN